MRALSIGLAVLIAATPVVLAEADTVTQPSVCIYNGLCGTQLTMPGLQVDGGAGVTGLLNAAGIFNDGGEFAENGIATDGGLTGQSLTTPQLQASAGFPSYVIPENGTVLSHVNATDLHNGTAKVGTVYTKDGTVTFNAGSPNSVGPYSDSNYFSLGSGDPSNVSTAPWTIALVFNPTSAESGVIFSTGAYEVSGIYVYTNSVAINKSGTEYACVPGGSANVAAWNVMSFGLDSSGTLWCNLNGTGSSTASTSMVVGTAGVNLGRYAAGGQPATHTDIAEVLIDEATPTSAALNTINTQTSANLAVTNNVYVEATLVGDAGASFVGGVSAS